jgi:methionyl-tRNA formyltransferase
VKTVRAALSADGLPAVKEAADSLGLPVLQFCSLRDDQAGSSWRYLPRIFSWWLPTGISFPGGFELPRLGTINLHPSLLPKYRGAAPVEWALYHGETRSGITVQRIDERLDAGDIVLQDEFGLDNTINAGELMDFVTGRSPELLLRAIAGLADGSLTPQPQIEKDATYCGKLDRDIARIDWTLSAAMIHNRVRALNPRPAAWCEFRGEQLKIWQTALCTEELPEPPAPGELLRFQKKRLLAGTGSGTLEILLLQQPNRKILDGAAFINGARLNPGERLG